MENLADRLVAKISNLQSKPVRARKEFRQLQTEYNDLIKLNSVVVKIERNDEIEKALASSCVKPVKIKVEKDDGLVKLERIVDPPLPNIDVKPNFVTTLEDDLKLESEVDLDEFSSATTICPRMSDHNGGLTNDQRQSECNVCGKKFKTLGYLNSHMKNHTKPFKCTICGKGFSSKAALTIHNRSHSGERPYECFICHKAFIVLDHLRKHMHTHTEGKNFPCHICKKQFRSQFYVEYHHSAVHGGVGTIKCRSCNKTFKTNKNLNIHMKTHINKNERKFVCHVCDKRFCRSDQLKEHMRKHTGEKPYECKICNRKFAFSSNLRSHMPVHSTERLFACNICSRKFKSKLHLRGHNMLCRTFTCDICQRYFRKFDTLKRHMFSQHVEFDV